MLSPGNEAEDADHVISGWDSIDRVDVTLADCTIVVPPDVGNKLYLNLMEVVSTFTYCNSADQLYN